MSLEIAAIAIFVLLLPYPLYRSARALIVMRRLFVNFTFPKSASREVSSFSGEHVEFESRDRVQLNGRLFTATTPTRRTIIFCPEAGSDWNALGSYGCYLPEQGFNVLTFTSRRAKEELSATRVRPWVTDLDVEDVRAAIRFAQRHFGTQQGEIGLLGISRGAGSAVCAAAEEPAVGAVTADGAFDTRWLIEDCMRKWTPRYLRIRTLPGFLYRFLSFIVVKWSERGLRLRFVSVLSSVNNARHVSFLLIHGKADRYIPEAQVSELYQRAEQTLSRHLWIVPKAGHNDSAKIASEEYAGRVSKFFATSLSAPTEFELVAHTTVEALQ